MKALCYILALVFVVSGGAKLASLPFEVEAFMRWGYPSWFMYTTGVLEVAGAIGLVIPRLSALAGACLAGLMLGAIATHLLHAEWVMFFVALGIATLCAIRAWLGRLEILQLFASKHRN